MNIPVISEDRKILKSIEKMHLPYFNTLMILNYLYYNRTINKDDFYIYLSELKKIAWYGSDILDFGEMVFKEIDNRRARSEKPCMT